MNTEIETADRGALSFANFESIVNDVKLIQRTFLTLGYHLSECLKHGYWKSFAESFEEFVAMPEIGMKKSQAYALVSVYRHYIESWECDPNDLINIGHAKLNLLLEKKAVNRDNVQEWLSEARVLGKRDLLIRLGKDNVEGDGMLRVELRKDDAGCSLFVFDGCEELPRGLYRLVGERNGFGAHEAVARLYGKVM